MCRCAVKKLLTHSPGPVVASPPHHHATKAFHCAGHVECCICLHNLIRIHYSTLHTGIVDEEDDQHNTVPGAWRRLAHLEDVQHVAVETGTPRLERGSGRPESITSTMQ